MNTLRISRGTAALVQTMAARAKAPDAWSSETKLHRAKGETVNADPIEAKYQVVMDDEGAARLWPADKKLPKGWRFEGKVGSKQECFDYINSGVGLEPPAKRERGFWGLWPIGGIRKAWWGVFPRP